MTMTCSSEDRLQRGCLCVFLRTAHINSFAISKTLQTQTGLTQFVEAESQRHWKGLGGMGCYETIWYLKS